MNTLNRRELKEIKLHAVNDMNQLNIPTYLLNAFNQRRKEDAIMNGE